MSLNRGRGWPCGVSPWSKAPRRAQTHPGRCCWGWGVGAGQEGLDPRQDGQEGGGPATRRSVPAPHRGGRPHPAPPPCSWLSPPAAAARVSDGWHPGPRGPSVSCPGGACTAPRESWGTGAAQPSAPSGAPRLGPAPPLRPAGCGCVQSPSLAAGPSGLWVLPHCPCTRGLCGHSRHRLLCGVHRDERKPGEGKSFQGTGRLAGHGHTG